MSITSETKVIVIIYKGKVLDFQLAFRLFERCDFCQNTVRTSTDYKTNTNSKSLAEKIPRSSSALSSSICFSISRCAQMSNAP